MDCGTGMSGSRRSDVVVDVLLLLSRFVAKVCEQKSAAAAASACPGAARWRSAYVALFRNHWHADSLSERPRRG